MQLSSSVFSNGETIPRRFTCDGEDLSPPFQWREPPKGTRSFVLLCNDPMPRRALSIIGHFTTFQQTEPSSRKDSIGPAKRKASNERSMISVV